MFLSVLFIKPFCRLNSSDNFSKQKKCLLKINKIISSLSLQFEFSKVEQILQFFSVFSFYMKSTLWILSTFHCTNLLEYQVILITNSCSFSKFQGELRKKDQDWFLYFWIKNSFLTMQGRGVRYSVEML